MTQPIPDGFRTVTPHLICQGAAEAIEFYKSALGAEERFRIPGPDGKSVMHAEIKIGDSVVMIAEELPEFGNRSPKTLGGSGVTIHLYVTDCDAAFQKAIEAGATPTMPCQDTFWGDRYGKVQDPFGHDWSFATHQEDLTPEQIGERMAKQFGGG